MTTSALGRPSKCRRLIVYDPVSKFKFLIDSGADVSVLPSNSSSSKYHIDYIPLFATNGSRIRTFGSKLLQLDLKLQKKILWTFILADVDTPILGNDFLEHYGLLIDIKNKLLIDPETGIQSKGMVKHCISNSIKTFNVNDPFQQILSEFPSITRNFNVKFIQKSNIKHQIITNCPPISCKVRRLDPVKLQQAKQEFEQLLQLGVVQRSKSPWASALHMVKKPNGTWRPCGDYRFLNNHTVADKYPIPNIRDFQSILHKKRLFSKIDLVKAFHQIAVAPEDVEKTAIITPFGLFEYLQMPFGLRNAAQTCQRFVHQIIEGLDFVFPYIDDFLIASSNMEEHKQHLKQLFTRLNEFGVVINPEKCEFGKTEISFLGYVINEHGIKPSPEKVDAIVNYPKPTNIEELRRFLGMFNYYRSSIPCVAELQAPLNEFQKGNPKKKQFLVWSEGQNIAFEELKTSLSKATLLAHPSPEGELFLYVDASNTAVGAVLQQKSNKEGVEKPLAFFSKKLSTPQCKYSAYDRELLAIYNSIKHFRFMLEGRHFTILTDHKPLTFLMQKKIDSCTPRQFRYLDFISQFSATIRHVSGTENVVADSLSRICQITIPPNISVEDLRKKQDMDKELPTLLLTPTSLKLLETKFPNESVKVYCDHSHGLIRPYIPKSLRLQVFENFHNLSHPGIRATLKLITSKFVWPGINKDVRLWSRSCLSCQKGKIQRHTKSPVGTIKDPDARFEHIHIDLIGPLPPSKGYIYCLTCIDRFSRWPEVIFLKDTKADTVAKALYENWICRFGVPLKITSDQGKQFECELFKELSRFLGFKHIRTTPYHPSSNGMIERFNRSLKTAIRCRSNENWVNSVPTILLGLRTTLKEDIGMSSAELVYGTNINLPGQFLSTSSLKLSHSEFLNNLQDNFRVLKPVSGSNHSVNKPFIYKDLEKSTHVFVRTDSIHPTLEPPYQGPFKILQRNNKYYTIEVNNKPKNISVDRFKPAFVENFNQSINKVHFSVI